MPYLVPDLCEDKSSWMTECALRGGASTGTTILDTVHLTPKVTPLLPGCTEEMGRSYSGTTLPGPFLSLLSVNQSSADMTYFTD